MDVAQIRSGEQPGLLLIIWQHTGVEGFCGSGCQVGFLMDRVYEGLPKTIGVALIHALNPYGFACLRRVNEDNVDLNRNFQDFTNPRPSSSAYEAIYDWLLPVDWDGAGAATCRFRDTELCPEAWICGVPGCCIGGPVFAG